MGITRYAKFDIFKEKIRRLSPSFDDEVIVSEEFLLEKSDTGNISIYYSPVEYINEEAIILFIGITPGFRQMKKAYAAVQESESDDTKEDILHKAKVASSYEGPMRNNLVQMIDQLGLPEYLQIDTSANLFRDANHLVHSTGLLPYPVFYKGKNFTGSTPNIWKTPLLKKYVLHCFVDDVSRLRNPLIIPLGVNVANVLKHLLEAGLLPNAHILTGFPHPSGANGHRHKQFATNKANMQQILSDYFRGTFITKKDWD